MFDIGFPELVLVSVVILLVLGPERLPEALRTFGLWLGRARRSFIAIKSEVEKEIGMDDIRRQLHNEAVMDEMRNLEQDVRDFGSDMKKQTDLSSSSDDAGSDAHNPVANESSETADQSTIHNPSATTTTTK